MTILESLVKELLQTGNPRAAGHVPEGLPDDLGFLRKKADSLRLL